MSFFIFSFVKKNYIYFKYLIKIGLSNIKFTKYVIYKNKFESTKYITVIIY